MLIIRPGQNGDHAPGETAPGISLMLNHEPPESGSDGSSASPAGCETPEPAGQFTLTLENIIDMTGELEHLNELVMIRLGREGGFSGQQSYFTIVTPILDRLEITIRQKYHEGMDRDALKILIRGWIDQEIGALQ
jgi:hypothetical protein